MVAEGSACVSKSYEFPWSAVKYSIVLTVVNNEFDLQAGEGSISGIFCGAAGESGHLATYVVGTFLDAFSHKWCNLFY